jgi:CRP-like cAMP-binding protein
MGVDSESLGNISYFTGLSSEELASISQHFAEKRVKTGDAILLEGEWSSYVYFVSYGMVKVYKTSIRCKEQILYTAQEGWPLNDVSVYCHIPNFISAVAMQPTLLYKIDGRALQDILVHYPKVAYNAAMIMARKVYRSHCLVEDLSFRSVTSRLANLLIKYSCNTSDLYLKQTDLAAAIGSTREAVSKALHELDSRGVIKYTDRKIDILDKDGLMEFVDL